MPRRAVSGALPFGQRISEFLARFFGKDLKPLDNPGMARGDVPVSLSDSARARMMRAHVHVDRIVRDREVVYGVTTGFGKLSEVAIPPERLAELQVNLVRSHASGVGAHLSREATRAMMLLRANVLAKGFSGARPVLPELLVGMLNAGLCPPIPEQGSVGASGDLAPLAHLGLALIGEGELHDSSGTGAAAEMLRKHSLESVALGTGFPFAEVPGLSNEMVERLVAACPATLAAAGRVRGITPAALAALLVFARRKALAA